MLRERFFSVDPIGEVDRAHVLQTGGRFNLGLAFLQNPGGAANPSFTLHGAHAIVQAMLAEQQRQEQRKETDFVRSQVQQALDQRLAALNAELTLIDTRLEEIRVRRIKIGEELEALDDIEALKREGKFDPANAAHAELARRAGLRPEEAAEISLSDLILRRQALTTEDGDLETERNERLKRREVVIAERQDVLTAQSEIERVDTEEARILAERRAETVLGAQQLGEAAYQTRSADAKQIAATAVGNAEVKERQQSSVAYNDLATTKGVDALMTDGEADFELDGAGGKSSTPTPGLG